MLLVGAACHHHTPAPSSASTTTLLHNFVVPMPKKLHETKPVSEWINHQCQPTPFVSNDCALQPSAGIHRLPDGWFNFFDDEVEVNGSPMTTVTVRSAHRVANPFQIGAV